VDGKEATATHLIGRTERITHQQEAGPMAQGFPGLSATGAAAVFQKRRGKNDIHEGGRKSGIKLIEGGEGYQQRDGGEQLLT